MEFAWEYSPNAFDENPVEVFKRNIYVHPFHEEDPKGLIELLGADRVLFGSDYPHPEGMADPITFVDDLEGLPEDSIRRSWAATSTASWASRRRQPPPPPEPRRVGLSA